MELPPIEIMVMDIPIHGDLLRLPKRITMVTQTLGDQAQINPNFVRTLIDLKAAANRLFIVQ